jgi:capsid protein
MSKPASLLALPLTPRSRVEELKRQLKAKTEEMAVHQERLDETNTRIGELQLQKLMLIVNQAVEASSPSDPVAKNTADRSVACRNDAQYSAALDALIARFRHQLVTLRNAASETLKKGAAKASFAADVTAAWAKVGDSMDIEAKEVEVERLKEEIRALSQAAIKHLSNITCITRPTTADELDQSI